MDQRAAVYLRVSTRDQTLANQVPDLHRMLCARDFAIVATYQDQESGVKRRPELERLLADARRNYFDTVLVWALDRLGRNKAETVANVLELERIGVRILSAREPWLDQTGPARSLLIDVFTWSAEQERTRLIERTNAGIARARAAGVRLGRPSVSLNPHAVALEFEKGGRLEQVAKRLGVGRATLCREIARFRKLGDCPRCGCYMPCLCVSKRVTTQTGDKPSKPHRANGSL